jgi:uncharacterized protein
MGLYLIIIGVMIISMLIQGRLKSKFKEYSQIPTSSGMSGAEVAQKMLHDNGINDVQVVSVDGFLSDNYDPTKKIVNLSPEVFTGRSIAAAAVAAHECGHAVQHQQAYIWLGLRSTLVPIVSFSSKFVMWILLAGVLLLNTFPVLLEAGIILFAFTTLFSVITLPVEIDASRRALVWIDKSGIMSTVDHSKAKDALTWAALTYVIAALASIATLLYYLSFLGGRRR